LLPNAIAYVDHSLGTNDLVHGGGPGACAYRTLTYALNHATGLISLATDTYQGGVAGETVPFLLTNVQGIVCDGSGTQATLMAAATSGSYDGVVQLAGEANTVQGCIIDGADEGGYCLVVSSSAATAPHTVTGCEVTHCANVAVNIAPGVSNVTLASNKFVLNGLSVYWTGDHAADTLTDNTFTADTNNDVYCDDASPGIVGSGNIRGGGPILCENCAGCPF
jgi:hypothetical protein